MRLEQGLKQTFKASLNLQQTINMLQLGSQDIQQLVKQELENNPFLAEGQNDHESLRDNEPDYEDAESEYSSHNAEEYDASYQEAHFSLNNLKTQYDGAYNDPLSNIAKEVSLKDHILEQLYLTKFNNKERIIAYYLTDMLTDSGYIEADFLELTSQLKCSVKTIEKVLLKLQNFEPTGVFARGLAECLKLQLKDKKLFNSSFATILNSLHRVAVKDFTGLAKLCSLSELEIRSMVNVIKELNPKPGSAFASNRIIARIPDVFVKRDKNGKFIVELNEESLPQVKVSRDYYMEMKLKVKNTDQRKFLSEKYYAAGMVISSLEQRNNAILKVAESLTRLQRSFFEKGVLCLEPLNLQDVARDIGMSESTVSRVTSNKYLAWNSALFEMKYFFAGGIQSQSSMDIISTTKVKELIKKLIELEDKKKIVSDEELSKELVKFNIKIARRTVAKYRDQLKIPTASIRRREKMDV